MSSYTGSYQAVLFDAAGQPTLQGYLAYFAFLFPILRWWRLADPLPLEPLQPLGHGGGRVLGGQS